MIAASRWILAAICAGAASLASAQAVTSAEKDGTVTLENALVRFEYGLTTGLYSVTDLRDNSVGVAGACFAINEFTSKDTTCSRTWSDKEVQDKLGRGRAVTLICSGGGRPDLIVEVALYEGRGALAIACSLDNKTAAPITIHDIYALADGKPFPSIAEKKDLKLLNGIAGAGDMVVNDGPSLDGPNNLLMTFTDGARKRSLVMGGLTYQEFAKFASIGDPRLAPKAPAPADAPAAADPEVVGNLYASDPVGKLVDAGQRYLSADRFYIDIATDNPFDALETYGLSVRAAQGAAPNLYNFPSVCGWYASMKEYGGGPDINNTPGLVAEMDAAERSGFLKYSKVAVRLVPDTYADDNEQGWWDDEHWRKYGHYLAPYDTTQKWAQAVLQRGGIPLTYFQTGFVSLDYAKAFPDHMLFKDPARAIGPDGHRISAGSYDFTSTAFRERMTQVWTNLSQGGVQGLMFDYPETGWRTDGGFEDKHATTASAYRAIFALAKTGLGAASYIHERNVEKVPFYDVSAGLVDSQRVWSDTDLATPEMYRKCALRWYKTRVLYSYDMDAKNLFKTQPNNRDGVRQLLTMAYMVSGRLLLANSFNAMTPDMVYDLSRIYPMLAVPKSPRPLDVFTTTGCPRIYDYAISPEWHQLAFFNPDPANEAVIGVEMGKDPAFGGVGLDPKRQYYVCDFWNNGYIGTVSGAEKFEQTLRPGEVRMMAVHAIADVPQFISTNRHVLQGYLDLERVNWDEATKTLSGVANVVRDDLYRTVIATNGWFPISSSASGARAHFRMPKEDSTDLIELCLARQDTGKTPWSITFAKMEEPPK
jgi:hypothetical protein